MLVDDAQLSVADTVCVARVTLHSAVWITMTFLDTTTNTTGIMAANADR